MSIRIVSPEGTAGPVPGRLVPSFATLRGRRVAVLDNGKPNALLLLTTIADEVAAQTEATVTLVAAKATAATPAEPEIIQQLAAADLVVTGSAD